VVLLVLATVQLVAWSILLPPFQGPDEISHFAYSQRMVETRSVPWFPFGDPQEGRASISTELDVASAWAATVALMGNLAERPAGSPVSFELWKQLDAPLTQAQRADGGYASAMAYPPLYYTYAAVPYAATVPLSIFDREFAMRLWNLPLLLAVVWLTWLIAGELLGPRRWPQTLATAAVALNPQLMHMAAIVNPEILLALEWTAFLWLSILVLRRGPTRWRLAGIAALCVAAGFTHVRGLAMLVPALFVVLWLLWQHRRPSRRTTIVAGVVLGLGSAAVLAGSVYLATGGHLGGPRVRQYLSYLWQFYLPRLGFMDPSPGPRWGLQQVFVDRFYGTYGALDVYFPPGALSLLKWLSIAGIALAIVGLAHRWKAVRRRPEVLILLALSGVAYLYLNHVAAFKSLITTGDPVLTGRYLLPFIAVYALAIGLGVSWLPKRWGPVAAGALTGALCLLSVAAFGITFARYYA
jgi:4-amino-4-deoxy-L-arabinose transferase-like glycosyltransferase